MIIFHTYTCYKYILPKYKCKRTHHVRLLSAQMLVFLSPNFSLKWPQIQAHLRLYVFFISSTILYWIYIYSTFDLYTWKNTFSNVAWFMAKNPLKSPKRAVNVNVIHGIYWSPINWLICYSKETLEDNIYYDIKTYTLVIFLLRIWLVSIHIHITSTFL